MMPVEAVLLGIVNQYVGVWRHGENGRRDLLTIDVLCSSTYQTWTVGDQTFASYDVSCITREGRLFCLVLSRHIPYVQVCTARRRVRGYLAERLGREPIAHWRTALSWYEVAMRVNARPVHLGTWAANIMGDGTPDTYSIAEVKPDDGGGHLVIAMGIGGVDMDYRLEVNRVEYMSFSGDCVFVGFYPTYHVFEGNLAGYESHEEAVLASQSQNTVRSWEHVS